MSHETILGHIVSRRLSRQYEDTATEALAYLLRTCSEAHTALVDLLREACPGELESELRFETQLKQDSSRMDLAAIGEDERRAVFVENKFWAGLTNGQPVRYLELLAEGRTPTILLVVAPQLRVDTLWSELKRRLRAAGGSFEELTSSALSSRYAHVASVGEGRRLAITSWTMLLQAISERVADKPRVLADLEQLRGLCKAADSQAFVPLDPEELTDQRIPTRLINYAELVRAIVEKARAKGFINRKSLRPSHNWGRVGRFIRFGSTKEDGVGAWIGVDFPRWKRCGRSPIWIRWRPGPFGQAERVRPRLIRWARKLGYFVDDDGKYLALAFDLKTMCERQDVIDSGVALIKEVGELLADLVGGDAPSEEDEDVEPV